MRKITIKEWPFPEKTKAMLLRVENPVYAGNGNWHTDVIFRSINKEDRKVNLDWGLLPMLKTGQIFSDGTKLYDKKNSKTTVFTFDNVEFEFFIDQIITDGGIVQRPAFRAKLGEAYYFIPAIEVVRSFFARTRRLAYALLETNSIIPLCQCEISTYPVKKVVVHLSPDCPADHASERWISTLVWMATDTLAQKSWSSFFHYFKSCQGLNVFPEKEGEIPVFPLNGKYSLTCGYRSYGKNIWIDEIIKVDCDSLDFDEIIVRKYITERGCGTKSKIITVKRSEKIEIVNSAQSALNRNVIADVDLPNLMFKKQPRISIIKKSIGIGLGGYKCIEKVEGSIAVTGKNDGYSKAYTGIDFVPIENLEKSDCVCENEALSLPGLNEASEEVLVYNRELLNYLSEINTLKLKLNLIGYSQKVYELPGYSSFATILPNVRRCCAISMLKLSNNKITYIIEADRTIYGSQKKWHIATLLLRFNEASYRDIIFNLVQLVALSGHWEEQRLLAMKNISFRRLKHISDKSSWTRNFRDAMSKL